MKPRPAALPAGFARRPIPGQSDIVQAYRSVAVYYDLAVIDFFQAAEQLQHMEESRPFEEPCGRLFTIPCCYDFGLDWPAPGGVHRLACRRYHSASLLDSFYRVRHRVLSRFPLYGLPARCHCRAPLVCRPRRLKVAAGSVGLTGKQTGIYTEERPGGWNIVGRTPLELVNVREEYFPLRTGDRVQFRRIDTTDYYQLSGERLPQHRGQRQ